MSGRVCECVARYGEIKKNNPTSAINLDVGNANHYV